MKTHRNIFVKKPDSIIGKPTTETEFEKCKSMSNEYQKGAKFNI